LTEQTLALPPINF